MSRIDDLITEHCPGGVKIRPLSEYVVENRGGGTPSTSKETLWGGEIPWASVGDLSIPGNVVTMTRSHITEEAVRTSTTNIVPRGDVIVAVKISPGNMKIAGTEIAINQDLRGLTLSPDLDGHFLTYFFQTLNIVGNGTIVKSITNSALMRTYIPVPPIEVQQQIVRILDQFTQLEAELEAELEARRKQYEYYRGSLLTFTDAEVEFKPLDEIFKTRNGYTPSRADRSNWEDGVVPWFRMEDIRENGRVLDKSIKRVSKSAVKGGRLFPANAILVATSATIGEHALITVPFLSNQRFTVLWPKPEFASALDMKFVFHYCFVLGEWCRNNTTMSSFASVDMSGFRSFRFPVPRIEDQRRIASTLDKFDALVNDLSVGLPAELAARRKQYEYYRDRLLTFKELPA